MGLVGIFKQQSLEAKSRFEAFARGLVRVLTPTTPRSAEFTVSVKYKIRSSESDDGLFKAKFPEMPMPMPFRDEIIPDPDSISLSVLNNPPGKRLEIDFAAYDPPEATLSALEETHPVLVRFPSPLLEILTAE